jgi:hypothetical protein
MGYVRQENVAHVRDFSTHDEVQFAEGTYSAAVMPHTTLLLRIFVQTNLNEDEMISAT